ncbi:GNAT family N-acetyltransferase [Asanoa sp. NPDC049573]|uniref:GNAT family N-acetyltransferase n=1 Tax=Asanoa sp. NPDC049573 TaxID=3155396 RepID=UPI00342F4D35
MAPASARTMRPIVKPVIPSGWRDLRKMRMRALAESPMAFLSDPAAESAWSQAQWMAACEQSHWFIARIGDSAVGLGRVADYPDESPRLHLEAMWVDPPRRKQGIGLELLDYAEGHARGRGETALGLWVIGGNDAALRLYESRGYVATGREGPLPDGRDEREFAHQLT